MDGISVRPWALLAAGAVGLLLILASVPVAAMTGGTAIVVAVPVGPYALGQSITATIHTYFGSSLADATNLTFYIYTGQSPYIPYGRKLTATQVSLGTYSSTFQLGAADLAWGWDVAPKYTGLQLRSDGIVGGVPDEGAAVILVDALPPGVQDVVTASSARVVPGQPVTFTTRVFWNNSLADADSVTGTLYLATSVGEYQTPPTPGVLSSAVAVFTHTGLGTYTTSYAAPAGLSERAVIRLVAAAWLGGGGAAAWADAIVEPPHPLVVWAHTARFNDTAFSLDIWVANDTGAEVPGVNVTICCVTPKGPPVANVTDAAGRAGFLFTHRAGTYWWVPFSGNATGAGVRQAFAGVVTSPLGFAPSMGSQLYTADHGFWTYAPGDQVTRNFTVPSPLVASSYHWYGWTDDGWSVAGSGTSDAHGNLSIGFTAPPQTVHLMFTWGSTMSWTYVTEDVYVASPSLLHVPALSAGSVARITADVPEASASVLFLPYNVSSPNPLAGNWSLVSSLEAPMDRVAGMGPNVSFDLVVPRFLPAPRDYLLILDVGDFSGNALDPVYPGFYISRVVHLGAASTGPSSGGGIVSRHLFVWLVVPAVGALIVVAAIVTWILVRRRRKGEPPAQRTPPS